MKNCMKPPNRSRRLAMRIFCMGNSISISSAYDLYIALKRACIYV